MLCAEAVVNYFASFANLIDVAIEYINEENNLPIHYQHQIKNITLIGLKNSSHLNNFKNIEKIALVNPEIASIDLKCLINIKKKLICCFVKIKKIEFLNTKLIQIDIHVDNYTKYISEDKNKSITTFM